MNTVQKITFKKDWRCFSQDWSFVPKRGLSLLVGDQGCGKSTLLNCLGENKAEVIDITLENNNVVETYYIDTEKHNPRSVASLNGTHLDTATILGSRFRSHGETLLPMVTSCMEGKDAIFFLDEPENGLSIRSQYEVQRAFWQAEKQGCQLFIATHSIVIIESVKEVFSLEHNAWMPSKEFLSSQKKTRIENEKPSPTKRQSPKRQKLQGPLMQE